MAVGVIAVAVAAARAGSQTSRLPIYVGTYTDGASRGIYLLDFDPAGATFSPARLVAEAVNPTFLAWHPTQPLLLAVSETDTVGAERSGGLLSYRVAADGTLLALDDVPTGGAGACHLSLDAAGRHVFVANYGAGSVAAFRLGEDGRLQRSSDVLQHSGRGTHRTRQTKPHAHAIDVAPGGRFVIAADLGTDALMVYRWDAARGTLTPHAPALAKTSAGAGPRHVTFHPNGRIAYVINELDSTVTTYAWDGEAGTLTSIASVPTLPEGWRGENTTAEIALHPSGRFLYASNRGHDSIAVFAIGADGALSRVAIQPTGGRTPRHFALDAEGRYLLAANQESDTIVAFRVDGQSGALADTGARVHVPSPVFVGIRPALPVP